MRDMMSLVRQLVYGTTLVGGLTLAGGRDKSVNTPDAKCINYYYSRPIRCEVGSPKTAGLTEVLANYSLRPCPLVHVLCNNRRFA
jgi:hypothetical protein